MRPTLPILLYMIITAFVFLACDQLASLSTSKAPGDSAAKISGDNLKPAVYPLMNKNILHIRWQEPQDTHSILSSKSDCLGFLLAEGKTATHATLVTAQHCVGSFNALSNQIEYREKLYLSEPGSDAYIAVTPSVYCGNDNHFLAEEIPTLSSLDLIFLRIEWPRPFVGFTLAEIPSYASHLEIYGQLQTNDEQHGTRNHLFAGEMDWQSNINVQPYKNAENPEPSYSRIFRQFEPGVAPEYEPGDSGGPLSYRNGEWALGLAIGRNGCQTKANYMVNLSSTSSRALLATYRNHLSEGKSEPVCTQSQLQEITKRPVACPGTHEEIANSNMGSKTVEHGLYDFYLRGQCQISFVRHPGTGRKFLVTVAHCAAAENALIEACQQHFECKSNPIKLSIESDLVLVEIDHVKSGDYAPIDVLPGSEVMDVGMYSCNTQLKCKHWPGSSPVMLYDVFKRYEERQTSIKHHFLTEAADSGGPIFELDGSTPTNIICLQIKAVGDANTCTNLLYWLGDYVKKH